MSGHNPNMGAGILNSAPVAPAGAEPHSHPSAHHALPASQ